MSARASGTGALTRRRAVIASARAAATLLVGAASGFGAPGAQARAGRDTTVLSGALRAERGLQDAYATAARAGGLSLAARAQMTRLGLNQKRAVEQFARSVGLAAPTPVPAPGVEAGSSGAGSGVLAALLDREERGIAEHAIALQRLESGASAVALARLMAAKAQHTVVLRRLLGREPLPRSFEPVAAR